MRRSPGARRVDGRRLSAGVVGVLLLPLLGGCGDGAALSSSQTVQFYARVTWPDTSVSQFPGTAEGALSARLTLKGAAADGSDLSVNAAGPSVRPGTTSVTSSAQARIGVWLLEGRFYATTMPTEPAIGIARGYVSVDVSVDYHALLSAGDRVALVEIPAGQSVKVGSKADLIFSARSKATVRDLIAIAPGAVAIQVTAGKDRLRITSGQLEGVAAGTATVVVTAAGVTSAPQTVIVSP